MVLPFHEFIDWIRCAFAHFTSKNRTTARPTIAASAATGFSRCYTAGSCNRPMQGLLQSEPTEGVSCMRGLLECSCDGARTVLS
jgi:hypothetical protein